VSSLAAFLAHVLGDALWYELFLLVGLVFLINLRFGMYRALYRHLKRG
jgi:hypothetical protein